MLLQEKGQLVSEAHGWIKLETETWSKVPSGSCPHTSRLCLSEAGMCTSRLLCASMQWLGHKCATANLAPSARGCPSAALRCSFTGFKHQLARSLQSCVPVRQPADIKNISAPLKSHLSVLRKCLVGWVSTQWTTQNYLKTVGMYILSKVFWLNTDAIDAHAICTISSPQTPSSRKYLPF